MVPRGLRDIVVDYGAHTVSARDNIALPSCMLSALKLAQRETIASLQSELEQANSAYLRLSRIDEALPLRNPQAAAA